MIKSHHLGLFLIALSFLPWVAVAAIVPLLPLSVTQKALMVPVLAVVAEILFWLLLVVSKEAAQRYRYHLSPRYLWKRFRNLMRRL